MIRRFPALPALAALLAVGCIENPGVDPGVGRTGTKVETTVLEPSFQERRLLHLRITRDSGRTSLKAVNRGLGTIDSAAFLIQMSSWHKSSSTYGWGFDPAPEFEYYGKVARLGPGAEADLGLIDTLQPGRLSEYHLHAVLTYASEEGRRGSPFGGVYTGSHRGVDTSGEAFHGVLRGIIGVDGDFRLHLFKHGSSYPMGMLIGAVTDSGSLSGRFELGYRNPGRDGRFLLLEDGLGGSFAFQDSFSELQSLTITCEPYSPR